MLLSWFLYTIVVIVGATQVTAQFSSQRSILTDGVSAFNAMVLSERPRKQCLIFEGKSDMFPCHYVKKSHYKPESVHRLQPGDIDVVAALGDSLTGGTGALGRNLGNLRTEFRGVTFSIGGLGTWQEYLTLPNILKNFNPNLRGMSIKNTQVYGMSLDGYNMAIGGSKTFNLTMQARRLVDRMKQDPNVDFYNDWKMVTILAGHNDLCSVVCRRESKNYDPKVELRHIAEALDLLHYELPRAFINLMPLADLGQLFDLRSLPFACLLLRKWLCPCLFGPFEEKTFSKYEVKHWLNSFARQLDDLIVSGRYNDREDFTVVLQPILIQGKIPNTKRGKPDLSYLGPDCFHLAQKTHALIARGLWNNLLQPIGRKSTTYERTTAFFCPSEERPYLATYANSNFMTSELTSNMEEFIAIMETRGRGMSCPI